MYWNKEQQENFLHNVQLFKKRFPDLAKLLNLHNQDFIHNIQNIIPQNYKLEECKKNNTVYTLLVDNRPVHSKYDSKKEAEQIFSDKFFSTNDINKICIFAGIGLGFVPELFINKYKTAKTLLIEPDIYIFFLFLSTRPLDMIFQHQNLIMLIGLSSSEVFNFLLSQEYTQAPLFFNKNLLINTLNWYTELEILLNRNKAREKINTRTARKFLPLWLRNICKNTYRLNKAYAISAFESIFKNSCTIVLAAGPSLDIQLQDLTTLKERNFILIAVDTALKACHKLKIEPDFIITGDPQFWNFLHIAGINISNSILVSEETVFPSTLRLNSKAHIIYTQNLPFRKYYEKQCTEYGTLKSGGSIATTAWSFAKFLGAKNIIMLGLDLGYPNKQTHFKGSTFEEKTHTIANKLLPAETQSFRSLISANIEYTDGYDGNTVLTDNRLQMYAWWFESETTKTIDTKTYNFMPKGIKIPGLEQISKDVLQTILSKTNFSEKKIKEILEKSLKSAKKIQIPHNIFNPIKKDIENKNQNSYIYKMLSDNNTTTSVEVEIEKTLQKSLKILKKYT